MLGSKTSHTKVILIVDDEVEMLSLLELTLKRQGFVVLKAENATMALELIRSLTPNLFILDLMMPGMDGFELIQHIRAHPSTTKTPIIILSARTDKESKDTALRFGANLYLQKTSVPNGLVQEVHTLLQGENETANLH